MVSCLTYKSLSHFQFIFVHGLRVCSSFIGLHVAVQFSQHHLLKRLSFSYFIFLPPQSKVNWCLGLFLGYYSVPLVYMSVLVPVPYYLDECGFVILPEVLGQLHLLLCFFFLRLSCNSWSLCFRVNFWIVCCSSVKNVMGNLMGIALNLQIWICCCQPTPEPQQRQI